MFETVISVKKTSGGSDIFEAYFLDYKEAKKFAESEVKKLKDNFVYSQRHYLDGSFDESWKGNVHEIVINDSSWASDYPTRKIRFMPLGLEFETEEEFHQFIKRSQQIANQ